jgi:hypothetical protein
MLFLVVAIQPSERWTCATRNSSMWPLNGSATPLTCRPMPRAPEFKSIGEINHAALPGREYVPVDKAVENINQRLTD